MFSLFNWSKSTSNNNVAETLTPPSAQEGETRVNTSHMSPDLQSASPPPTTTAMSPSPPAQRQLTPTESELEVKPIEKPKPRKKRAKPVPIAPPPPSPFKLPPSPSSAKSLGVSANILHSSNAQTADFEAGMEQTLSALLHSVPAKTLHSYLTSRLSKLPPSELISLSNILCELEPPPLRHCVRCHKDFTDVDNNDRSCVVPHDDNSAIIQYASRTRNNGGPKGRETFWGCCGNTVDGEGELGPPSGWCYEGMHTVDPKRARWRDDSTPQEDKLLSCQDAGCLKKHAPNSSRPSRAKGTKRLREIVESTDEEVSETEVSFQPLKRTSISPSAISVRSTRSARRRAGSPTFSMYSARRRSPSLTPSIEMADVSSNPVGKDITKKKRSELMKSRSAKSVNGADVDAKTAGKRKSNSSKAVSKMNKVLKEVVSTLPTGIIVKSDSDKEIGAAVKTSKAKKRRVS